MPSISINPLSFGQRILSDPKSGAINQKELTKFLSDLSQWANQIQQSVLSPSVLASIFLGNNLLNPSAQSIVQTSSSVSTNQTIDTKKSSFVFLYYTWTGASNPTFTLNNVVDGQIVMFRMFQNSGAARTVTVLANTPAPSAITVQTASSTLSSGASVANGVTVAILALASATNSLLEGPGQNW